MNNYANLVLNQTLIEPKTILEIGSRDGHDAETLRRRFNIDPSNVFIVEPNPNQSEKIKRDYKDFKIINFAIYNSEGKMSFNKVNNQELVGISSLLDRNDNIYNRVESEVIEVEVITGERLLDIIDVDIDLCKVDVEGVTYEVLESFQNIARIKSFHLECEHKEIWKNQKLYEEVSALLKEKKYVQIYFEYVNGVPTQSDSIWVLKDFLK